MANLTAEEFYQEVESFAQTEVAPRLKSASGRVRLTARSSKMGSRGLLAVNVSRNSVARGWCCRVCKRGEAHRRSRCLDCCHHGGHQHGWGSHSTIRHRCTEEALLPKARLRRIFRGPLRSVNLALVQMPHHFKRRRSARAIDWVISGQKMWITSGTEAGVFVVWARTSGSGAKGITCFLVDKGATGPWVR